MAKIAKGNKVELDYEGRLESGEVFDSSKHGDHSHPLAFEVGSGKVIKGFDDAVVGMSVGEEKEFTIKKEEAYGEYNPALRQEIPKNVLPKGPEPKAGMVLVMQSPDGQQMPVKISEVKAESIVLDMNHPLAGKDLTFKIKILKVE